MILQDIKKLVLYGLHTGLIEEEDKIYTINKLIELFGLDSPEEYGSSAEAAEEDLESILRDMTDYAYETGILSEDGIVYRDLFDTKTMGMLVPRPSEVIRRFKELYAISPKKATDFYYQFSQDTDYIRRYRIKKDQKWLASTKYGRGISSLHAVCSTKASSSAKSHTSLR